MTDSHATATVLKARRLPIIFGWTNRVKADRKVVISDRKSEKWSDLIGSRREAGAGAFGILGLVLSSWLLLTS
jgi:hypothetical protein